VKTGHDKHEGNQLFRAERMTEFCDPGNEQSGLKREGNFLSRLESVVKKSSLLGVN